MVALATRNQMVAAARTREVTPGQMETSTPIEFLAYLADATPEQCVSAGAEWTLGKVFEQRLVIRAIMFVRRFTGSGLAHGKGLAGLATIERVRRLGQAVDRRDSAAAVQVLEDWAPLHERDDPELHERLASTLLEAFAAGQ